MTRYGCVQLVLCIDIASAEEGTDRNKLEVNVTRSQPVGNDDIPSGGRGHERVAIPVTSRPRAKPQNSMVQRDLWLPMLLKNGIHTACKAGHVLKQCCHICQVGQHLIQRRWLMTSDFISPPVIWAHSITSLSHYLELIFAHLKTLGQPSATARASSQPYTKVQKCKVAGIVTVHDLSSTETLATDAQHIVTKFLLSIQSLYSYCT
jgi:hypothetical protein